MHLPVAQLDSALDSDSKGQRFESARAGHEKALATQVLFQLYLPFGE